MQDQLFVFRPSFDDRGTPYFCPYSAQVIGFLVPGVDVAEINGRKVVEKTLQILRYLAATRRVPAPH